LWNESFFSAPQLKRDPLGGTNRMVRRFLELPQLFMYWLLWRLSERRQIRGFQIGTVGLEAEQRNIVLGKLDTALATIATNDPRRFRRIQLDVPRLLVSGRQVLHLGRWHERLRMCQLAEDWILKPSTSATSIASTIVHEATHARLSLVPYDEKYSHRVERACYHQEEVFAARLPDGAHLVAQARRAQQLPDTFYSKDNRRARTIETMQALGWPTWLVRALRVLFRVGAA